MLARQLGQEPLHEWSRVLDLCTGSGLLAVVAAARARHGVVAVDISRRAVFAARVNATLNGVSVRAMRGDLFEPVGSARFDVIVSNPPYLPTSDRQLPRRGPSRAWEGGPHGRTFIDRICTQAPRHLRPGGTLLLVHSAVCGERETLAALSREGLQAGVVARECGPLGPRLGARADWLFEQGLLAADALEEILVIRAQLPSAGTETRLARAASG